jgi:hypothetical protein
MFRGRRKALRLTDAQRYTDQEQALFYIACLRPNTVDAAELCAVLRDIWQTAAEALAEGAGRGPAPRRGRQEW